MKSQFEGLVVAAQSIVDQAKVLGSKPEFEDAYAAFVDGIDFHDRYGTRQKDLSDDAVDMLILNDFFFEIDDEGRLTVEHSYTRSTWIDGKWVDLEEEVES